MNQPVILPKAYREFFEAWEWYESKKEGLGDLFKDKIFTTIHRVAQNPLFYPTKKHPYREALIDVFPYLVVFRFFPRKRKVAIVSIFHCKRNPVDKY